MAVAADLCTPAAFPHEPSAACENLEHIAWAYQGTPNKYGLIRRPLFCHDMPCT